jgi:hypothetical protein
VSFRYVSRILWQRCARSIQLRVGSIVGWYVGLDIAILGAELLKTVSEEGNVPQL